MKTPISIRTTDGLTIVEAVFLGAELPKLTARKIVGRIMEEYLKNPLQIENRDHIIAMHVKVDQSIKKNQKRFMFESIVYFEKGVSYDHKAIKGVVTTHYESEASTAA